MFKKIFFDPNRLKQLAFPLNRLGKKLLEKAPWKTHCYLVGSELPREKGKKKKAKRKKVNKKEAAAKMKRSQ